MKQNRFRHLVALILLMCVMMGKAQTIALSAAYLALEKSVDASEVIVVMPCDTYAEIGYFETVGT
ncbi:MAG: hypothetical protein IIU50_04405, partial [Bacteroidaceae bacterium]|nr:hypothetical protein [Bacteroidaceae bacterium]